ncbi:TlpA family protein disulfide reductase [Pontibacter silvestris]|uniref:TlpA family protein disulfide reductase n=1 Tax=Pontibacter silvestris TaxID=2305183 RepID=UPI001E2ED467|nr:TlpA disulfide reductase family protein [Pontibacter silvestris]MCC9138020.1 TlpA family protein disulfide reductase [Pontibacter silvestris]
MCKENKFYYESGLTFFKLYPQLWNDTLTSPDVILASMRKSQLAATEKLKKARIRNVKFTQLTAADISYFAPSKLFDLIFKNNAWSVGKASEYSKQKWLQALKESYASLPLSNSAAIGSYHYGQTIAYYPRFLEMSFSKEEDFIKLTEKVFQKPFMEVTKEMKSKGKRFGEYKVINYSLKGQALESALSSLIINGVASGELAYLPEAYKDFKSRFPNSTYLTHVQKVIQPLLEKTPHNPDSEIKFDADSNLYNTLEEVLVQNKGRVVYVDMWGSWCGPCREEFNYTAALREHFKGKPADFVYIAFEHSIEPERTWKEAVVFYNVKGRHVLGNTVLQEYFRNLYANKGILTFPSYLLVNKEGNIVNVHAEHPSAVNKLYFQIEELLK